MSNAAIFTFATFLELFGSMYEWLDKPKEGQSITKKN